MVCQAGLDVGRVIHGILEGELSLDDAQAAWIRAIGHIRAVAERQRAEASQAVNDMVVAWPLWRPGCSVLDPSPSDTLRAPLPGTALPSTSALL
jgi:hypothetical protein